MRILVNALSATAPSGQHVLFGHVRQLAQWTAGEHDFHILICPKTMPADAEIGPNVHWHSAPQTVQTWLRRTFWEARSLPKWMTAHRMDLYFTPTGTILLQSPVPQVSLAQNPWCMAPAVDKNFREQGKALAQRAAYRAAQRSADMMVYNSNHMRQLYCQNAGGREARRGAVAYQGIHAETHAVAQKTRDPFAKDRNTILCVSVMARWKNCETLLKSVRQLHDRGIAAKLRLIGGWPESRYRQEIETEIDRLKLSSHVQIEGHVPADKLLEAYRSAKVYCLLSRCESFGIPAVEAQAFGTPVVGSNTGAMPEIGGAGGIFVNPDDATAAAEALEQLLTDDRIWTALSSAAIENSDRYRWEQCSRPLMEMFSLNSNLLGNAP